MRKQRWLTLAATVWLGGAPAAVAQHFEGTVTFRNITVQREALEERDFDLSEAIFDVALYRILALRDELEADGAMEVMEAQIVMKRGRLRFDAPGGKAYAVLDFETGVMRLVRPEQQLYVEMTREDRERMQAMSGRAADECAVPDARRTGEQRSMHGMRCTMYALMTDDGPARVCVSTDARDS